MKRTRLNPISDKQKEKNKNWKEVTAQKAKDLDYICQWCGKLGSLNNAYNPLDGHHIIKRRFNIHTYENCYICHRLCHREIEDNNIDVREMEEKE